MNYILSSIQWTIFILAGTLVAPLSIGFAFDMTPVEIAGLLQRTFFVIGLTSLLQAVFGHKLPLNEGPAGLWWGVFLIFASSGHGGTDTILRSLEMGLLISGLLFLILSGFRLIHVVKKLFTPLVTGTYLILLVTQLSGPFANGIFGVGYLTEEVNVTVAVCAVTTLVLGIVLAKSRYKRLRSYSVLISLVFGWLLFALAGITKPSAIHIHSLISFPELFAWGVPSYNLGVILTAILTSFLLLTNLVASVDVVAKVTGERGRGKVNYNRSGFVMGINHFISGIFSTVGGIPISAAAGFIFTTKIKEKLPFLIGSALIMMMSFFPAVMGFFASLPVPVGYATLFLSISSLIGIGLQEYRSVLDNEHARFIAGISLMAGIGTMFVPGEAWEHLPGGITSIFNNGLILGVLVCIAAEQFMKKKKVRCVEGKSIE